MAFEAGDKFGDAAFDGGLGFRGDEIADDLAAKGGGHGAKLGVRARRESQRDDKRRRKNGFARFFVELDGNLDDGTGINAELPVNVAMYGEAMAAVAGRNERGAQGNAFDGALNRDVAFARV